MRQNRWTMVFKRTSGVVHLAGSGNHHSGGRSHKGFNVLDTVSHTLLEIKIDNSDLSRLKIIKPEDVPNPNWLHPGLVSAGQQQFGDALLAQYPLVIVPSVVSTKSWNLLVNTETAVSLFSLAGSEAFALDTRLAVPIK